MGVRMDSDAVVSPGWLAERLDDPDVSVVDVREGWEYDGIGHIPGAVSIPFDRFRSEEGAAGMLPDPETWRELLSGVGVGADDHLVAYDDTHGVFAARFLVTALLLGHDPAKLHLLDGDYSAWTREHETEGTTPERAPSEYRRTAPSSSPLVDTEAVADAVDSGAVLVDTRSPEEYAEAHIPGAVNLDWKALVDDETRGLKAEGVLRETLESKGILPKKRVVLYCNTARRISHTYVVLKWLGYDDVGFYEGSMTEWVAENRPTESS